MLSDEVPPSGVVDQSDRIDGPLRWLGCARGGVLELDLSRERRRLAQQREPWHIVVLREPASSVRMDHLTESFRTLERAGRCGRGDLRQRGGECSAQTELGHTLA